MGVVFLGVHGHVSHSVLTTLCNTWAIITRVCHDKAQFWRLFVPGTLRKVLHTYVLRLCVASTAIEYITRFIWAKVTTK